MEFHTTIAIPATAAELQRRLTIGDLPRWCASIEKVLQDAMTSGEIYSVWGTFQVCREVMQYGVRFTLPGCANALQWTITTGHQPDPAQTVVHATINRIRQDQEFVDTLEQFVQDWKSGLEAHW